MSPGEKAAAQIVRLLREVRQDLAAAERHADRVAERVGRAGTAVPGEDAMVAMGSAVHDAYTALESAFERIARDLDEHLPVGASWHVELMAQMTLAIQDRRPAVLSADAAEALKPLRAHRHWQRHAYRDTWDWVRLEATVRAAPSAVRAAVADVARFVDALERAATEAP